MSNRLPETKCLSDILPKGREGGLEFARLVDLLLFYEARRQGQTMMLFSDRAGDYAGLDSFSDGPTRRDGRVGYQYKFYPSPLSNEHRNEIKHALRKADEARWEQKPAQRIRKWVLVTPDDLTESTKRKDLGDVSWFENLRTQLKVDFAIEHFGHRKLQALLMATPTLCLFYWPELIPKGASRRRSIEEIRLQYDTNLKDNYGRISFVGMSVYKLEASKGVPMEHIYIPLTIVAEGEDDRDPNTSRNNPLALLKPGNRHVILGAPGSGKSTLLKFISLAGLSVALQQRYDIQPDRRLPIIIILRKYADALKSAPNLALLDYILSDLRTEFSLPHADQEFLEYYLESGNAILLFDGMDELPNPRFKQTIRDRTNCLLNNYPACTAIITSRIVGYESPFRFDDKNYHHHKLARLSQTEMANFVRDWYAMRLENESQRQANTRDLVRILQDKQQTAIQELASNPLLLTIIALVHRIDAVLPDERVVLYQKCTETLLNTWHAWRSANNQQEQRCKTERRNRNRIEALAHWMHVNAGATRAYQCSVVPHKQILKFLLGYIQQHEHHVNPDDAEDVAEDFLTYIKNSTGLLIEVGDHQYSFIHLTFQEYLTATWLTAKMEHGGTEKLWEMIEQHVSDPRWQEVVRLLVGGMRNDDCQVFLCQKLLATAETKPSSHLAALLCGLLEDGIDAAEINGAEIAKHLFNACVTEQEPELFNRLLMLAKDFSGSGQEKQTWLEQGYSRAFAKTNEQVNMLLIGFSVGFEKEQLQAFGNIKLTHTHFEALNYLLTSNKTAKVTQVLASKLKLHYTELAVFATTTEWANTLAAMAESVLAPRQLACNSFCLRLFLTINMASGSFTDFGHDIGLMFGNWLPKARGSASAQTKAQAQTRERALARAQAQTRAQDRARARARTWAQAEAAAEAQKRGQAQVRARAAALANSGGPSIRETIALALHEFDQPTAEPQSNLQRSETVWTAIQINKEFTNDLLDLCVNGLQLTPAQLWKEALRTAFLPQVPARLWLYHPETWQQVETRFANDRFDENDTYTAAWLLLHDIWLFFYETHSSPWDSRFSRLAELTRQHPAPQLQIAHCLRDIIYGNTAREADLEKMLVDPAFTPIWREAMWID